MLQISVKIAKTQQISGKLPAILNNTLDTTQQTLQRLLQQ